MIFSENRFPLFGIMLSLTGSPRLGKARQHRFTDEMRDFHDFDA